jgi:hypothetical protein
MPFFGSMLVIGAAPAARAAILPVTFAQAMESSDTANPNIFAYNNNGMGSDAELGTSLGGALGVAVPINFTFLAGAGSLPMDLTGVQDATISMTSSTLSTATTAFGGTFADQPITGGGSVIDTIKITRTSAAGEGAGSRMNLLTVTFTGNLDGAIGGTTPSLNADSGLGNTVIYSSDFLSFAQSTEEDFNLAFSSWDPLVTPPSGLGINSDNYFNSATAAGTGTFDFAGAATVIPEPGALPALILGGLVLMAGRRRRHPARSNGQLQLAAAF